MRALISVFDKENIVEFAKELVDLGWEIISTGGTYKLLKEEGLEVLAVEEVTGAREILDGRVKTLNPKIHGAILYDRDKGSHLETIKEEGIGSIDMVVNNLYPFKRTMEEGKSHQDIIEMIDIGGPSMIRAAAKNYKDVIVVTDISDYDKVITRLKNNSLDLDIRRILAAKAFRITSDYDRLVSKYIQGDDFFFRDKIALELEKVQDLRYGENPHQEAAYYRYREFNPLGEANLIKHHGKDLSYNNLNDLYSAIRAVKNFKDQPACVAVKHTNPCGIGLGEDSYQAYKRAYECDTESIFGGIVAFNCQVDHKAALEMNKIFLEIIVAPKFTEDAFEILSEKKNLRIVTIDNLEEFNLPDIEYKETINGFLAQEVDLVEDYDYKVVTKRQPSEKEMEDLKFAFKAVKAVASNGVVLAKDQATVGIGQGQTKRSWAVEQAIDHAIDLDGAVLASDGFFFPDTIEILNKNGIKAIIQPGGSVRDQEVIDLADEYGMSIVFTGVRHFRH